MDYDETHICNVIKVICSANEEQIIEGLNELKKISLQELLKHHVFRKEDFFASLMMLISSNNSDIQHLVLNIAYSYAAYPEFIVQVHNYGLYHFMSLLKATKHKYVQQDLMHFLCRQITYEPSKIFLYEKKVSSLIISTLQCCETYEAKYYGIKLLRLLSTSKEKMNKILDEKGLYTACMVGLSLTCSNLCQLTMLYIMSYIKRNCIGPLFFGQVITGTDNLQTFKKILEQDCRYKNDIFEIFLVIFSHHVNCTSIQQYSKNVQVLDYLCMASLPLMIVNELSSANPDIKIDRRKIILALCKMCELGSQWRKYSFNVLPSYHDRTWMQISSEKKISIFITLLTSYQNDKELLQALLRAILGLQNLHSNKYYILKQFIEANILLLITKIFDKALKIACDYVNDDNVVSKCNHYNPPKIAKSKSNSYVKLMPPDILEFISQPPGNSKVSPAKKSIIKLHSDSLKEAEGTSLSLLNNSKEVSLSAMEKASSPPSVPSPNSQIAVVYKEINKIKFRTGNKNKSKRDRSLSVSEGVKGDPQSKTNLRRTMSSCLSLHNNRGVFHDQSPKTERTANKCLNETTQYWVKILEYLVRFLHQILVFKEDLNNICKEFLPKIFTYISKACIVHDSANLFLEVLAKNTSCIQYVLDILFIPMLVVDLRDSDLSVNCPQCNQINKGINKFLDKIGFFFSHFHQYGRCEIANRLNPSKDAKVKNSSLVAVTHVTKCPLLLYDFLIEHRGLDQLLCIFNSFNSDEKIHLYAVASVSSLMSNMKSSYSRKHSNICIFCDTNVAHLPDSKPESSKDKKNQLLFLTSSTYQNHNFIHSICKVNDECNKNCCFKLNGGKQILANRELLSVRNEVLKNMLLGSFSESLENCVEIKDITSHVMEMVLHFTYGCTCDIFLCKDVSIYAELLFVAEMYFIPELQILAMHYLSELICSETISAFLDEYIHLMSNQLLQHLFCSLLSQPGLTISDKAQLVDQLLLGKEKDTFIRNVQTGVPNIMKQISSLCNCDVFYEPIH